MNGQMFTLLSGLLAQFLSVIPNLLGAIVVIGIGTFVARLVSRITFQVLKKSGIDRIGERLNDIDMIEKMNIRIEISEVLARILYYILMLFFFVAATDILNMQVISTLMSDLIAYVPLLLSACVVMMIGVLIADSLRKVVLTTCQSLGIPSGKMIANFLFYFILISVLMSALTQAKINTDFIKQNLSIVLGGIVLAFSIGYGFASRAIMANFLASFYSKERYKIGDNLKIGDAQGIVSQVDSTTLTLKTAENKKIIIPLSKLTTEIVEVLPS